MRVGVQFEAHRIQPRGSILGRAVRGERVRTRRAPIRIILWGLIVLFSVAIAGQLLFHFVVSPRLVLKRITLQGDPVLTEAQVADAAGVGYGASLVGLDADRLRVRLESNPAVRRAAVRRQLPDTLVVDMEARRALVMALVATPEGTIPVLIDEEGLIFAAGPTAAAHDVPVISGLDFAKWEPGTRLPAMLRPLLEDLRRLKVDEPALFAFISEVVVARAGERGVELLIYPASYVTPIRVGGRLTAELLKNAALLLDVVRREALEDRVQEVDLRAREVVYREKTGG